ncbi:MAG: zf-HC2 domain-containing protein [Bacteroidota bacterium]
MKTKPVNKVRCTEAAKYVCENLDEQLNSRKCRAIKKHLLTCPKCSKDLIDMKKVIALYRKETVPHIPKAIQKRLLASISHK